MNEQTINRIAEYLTWNNYHAALEAMLNATGQERRQNIIAALTKASPSLAALRDHMNSLEAEIEDYNIGNNTCNIHPIRLDEIIDTTSLPTYGGAEPNDTTGIYSWDEKSYLTTDSYEASRLDETDGIIWITKRRKDI